MPGMPRRPRWADLRDSSNEGMSRESFPAPPVSVDSYRGPPEAGLDANSKAELNQRLKFAADLEAQPRDFTFLIDKKSPQVEETALLTDQCERRTQIAVASSALFGVDLSPPISPTALGPLPAFFAECPLTGAPTDFAFLFGDYDGSRLRESLDAQQEDDGEVALSGEFDVFKSVDGSSKRCRPLVPASPTGKRARATDAVGSADGGSAPARGRRALPVVVVPTEQNPEATLWQRRVEKRRLAVLAGKASPEYQAYMQARPPDARLHGEPLTPNAEDQTVSKRQWDDEVRFWRTALRQWEPEGPACPL